LASAFFAWLTGRHLAKLYRWEKNAVQAAEKAIAARDELLGIVAHDLRSPLTAIAMKSAVLQCNPTDVENVRKQSESIKIVTMRMEYLIRSLLDAASVESGRFSVSTAPCDVEAVVHDAAEMLAGLALPTAIRMDTHFRQPGLRVSADRERTIQVLTNLVGNAIKFASEGGKVRVTVERDGYDVHFSVADTGPGIDPAHLPHVFDRFWKVETGGRKGTLRANVA